MALRLPKMFLRSDSDRLQRLKEPQSRIARLLPKALIILLLTLLGFVVMGYHPGVEDDAVYLSAINASLDPALYPHDADFFRLQLQATVFPRCVASFVRITGISVPWAELLGQLLSLYLTLWAVHRIAQRLFTLRHAQWAGVALVAAMFSLPVAGSALNLADQYLHPRNLATAIVLLAVDRTLARKLWQAVPLLLAAFAIHPIMAAFGASFCFFLSLAQMDSVHNWFKAFKPGESHAAAPLTWMFEPPSPTWRRALETRRYYFLSRWTWYEWLGAIGPLILFWMLWRFSLRRSRPQLARFALSVVLYGLFQQAVAMVILGSSALIRLTPLQPMRYLHLEYIFLVLIAGCLLSEFLLHRSLWRWLIFFCAINGGMFASQRMLFANTDHLELPNRPSNNPWLQAFTWIRNNTPADAYFALDPNYLSAPGEDYHSLRALAQRSQLADAIKDTAVVTQVPGLGPRWAKEVDAQQNWSRFKRVDFERLNTRFGVNWLLVSYPPPENLPCTWHNASLSICQIP
jgi:hypothetical protein